MNVMTYPHNVDKYVENHSFNEYLTNVNEKMNHYF